MIAAKIVDVAAAELASITGQTAVTRRAKKSIAQFKVRQGMAIGASVTLRGDGRKTTGQRLTYFSADQRYVVTGTPVTIVDACGRELDLCDLFVIDSGRRFRTARDSIQSKQDETRRAVARAVRSEAGYFVDNSILEAGE